jgi:NAD(P)-dependent dehydrogenase (short-subunit alcohol dehydrogenase family)
MKVGWEARGWETDCMTIDGIPPVGDLALITGGSGQLGPVWCEVLREMGYRIHNVDLPQFDISDRDRMKYAADRCIAIHGTPKIIILNAGIDNPPGTESTFHGNLSRIIDVNLKGAANVTEVFLPAMIADGGGVIVGISSIQAHAGADWRNYPEGFEKPVGYNMSKAALEQYARSLTVQYGRFGIRACCIGFGAYDGGKLDPIFLEKYLKNVPMGRPVSRESAKAAMVFALTCPEFSGQTVMVEGGYLAI